jgi:hypothetical protein
MFSSLAKHFEISSPDSIESGFRTDLSKRNIPRCNGTHGAVEWVNVESALRLDKFAEDGWLVPPGATHWGLRIRHYLYHLILRHDGPVFKCTSWEDDWDKWETKVIGRTNFTTDEIYISGTISSIHSFVC